MPNRIVKHNGIPEHEEWCGCLHRRLEWEDRQEAEYAVRLLAAQDIELRHAKHATDAEWASHFDAECPRVTAVNHG